MELNQAVNEAKSQVGYGYVSSQTSPSLSHPSVAGEVWYWPKHILHSGWLCITLCRAALTL